MQGLDVVGPVILEQELVKDRNRRIYIIKQHKQWEKKLVHISIRHMRKDGSVERDVMPVASAIMRFGASMLAMSGFGRERFIARQPVTMVMMRYDYRHKHHDTNKQHHILVYFLFSSHTSDYKSKKFLITTQLCLLIKCIHIQNKQGAVSKQNLAY